MKKILLITWFNNNNFGTLLQATAMQDILNNLQIENEEFKCDILNYQPLPRKSIKGLSYYFNPKNYYLKLQQVFFKIYERLYNDNLICQTNVFKEYIEKNLMIYPKECIQSVDKLKQLTAEYDYFICGSDQIWNPKSLDPNYLLGWVSNGKIKASYGSSLSSSTIPKQYYDLYRKNLCNFKYISIRDIKCKEQLEKIVEKKIETVVDPVILWGRDNLMKFSAQKSCINNDYCFAYILGPDKKIREKFLKFCNMYILQPISVVGVSKENLIYDKEIIRYSDWETDPIKFINYIKNAKFIITDSFHSTVISILLHKDFWVFEKDKNRKEQNNRILELLDAVGLMDRWRKSDEKIENKGISKERWDEVDEKIEILRKKSMVFLNKIFKD